MFVLTNSTTKKEYVEIFINDICIYLQYFNTISAKISEHHEANPGLDFVLQWSRQAISTWWSRLGRYLFRMELPPIMLSGCDWAPENLNSFNKS